MTTATGETIGIVGILAQLALPPHNPQEHEPLPLYPSRSTTTPVEPRRHAQHPSQTHRPDISNDPSSSYHDSKSMSVEDDPATMQRLHYKDQAFKRRGYPIYPIDKRDTRGLKIAIILHGVLAHKDQIYHKQLARALPLDSFRFDFRANGETPGTWSMGNLADDVEDLVAVVDYLRTKLEYTVEIIIGHSRGGLVGFAWFAKHCPDVLPPSLRIPFFVGVSARFNMANIHERDPMYLSAFAKEGFLRWQARVAGQDKEVHVYPEQVEQFAAWPTREIALAFPYKTDVLLIHGSADKSVPVSDVASYSNILSGVHRRPASCSVKLIDHADHLFRGFYPQVVEAIVEWLRERSELTKLGLSAAAIRDRDTLGLARFNPSHFSQGSGGPRLWDNNLAAVPPTRSSSALTHAVAPWSDRGLPQPTDQHVSPYARYMSTPVHPQQQPPHSSSRSDSPATAAPAPAATSRDFDTTATPYPFVVVPLQAQSRASLTELPSPEPPLANTLWPSHSSSYSYPSGAAREKRESESAAEQQARSTPPPPPVIFSSPRTKSRL